MPQAAAEIIAHRGASYDAPENTLSAVELAWRQGAHAVEVDLWLTADEQIVCMHDATALRTCGVDRPVGSMTAAELAKLNAAHYRGPGFEPEPPPLLPEILATVPEGRRVYLEVKCGAEIGPLIQRDVGASGLGADQVSLLCFGYDRIQALKKVCIEYQCILIYDYMPAVIPAAIDSLDRAIEAVIQAKLDGIDLYWQGRMTEQNIRDIRQKGLRLLAWTVDEAEIARELIENGFDGITTNRPGLMRESLKT
ncbi:MAG: glycerophosphodiester phosphodiesterase family protein [Candidatus Sumerlaeia bacterium]